MPTRFFSKKELNLTKQFKGVRPLLQEELGKGAAKAIDRTRALEDMRRMLEDKNVTVEKGTRQLLQDMLNEYDNYLSSRDFASTPGSGLTQEYVDMLRTTAVDSLKSIAEGNANAMAAYNSLFGPLFR